MVFRDKRSLNGIAVVMVVLWCYGIWLFNQRYNEIWNFRELAARLEQSAAGGEVAVFQHRDDWVSIDSYLDEMAELVPRGYRHSMTQSTDSTITR